MLSSYRRVLARPGALLFSSTGLVARLPISMLGIGIVLLVADATGSYGVAGTVSAVYVVANAVFAVVQGRLVDTLGQRRVLPAATVVYAVALAGLMTAVQLGWPLAVAFGCAFLSGAALPQVGACVRARWTHVLDRPAERQTAFALEAVLDEVVFVVGPIVVAVLATTVHPLAGLAVALVLGLAGPLALAAQHATEPPVHPVRHGDGGRPRMPWAVVAPLVVVMAALGAVFGGTEVTTIAFTDELGARRWSGLLLALWAAGSLVAGVLTGAISWRRGPAYRLALGSLGMGLMLVPLPFVTSMALMGGWLFVCGFAISPTLIASISLVERVAPPRRLTEAMGVLHTGLAAGVALGAALAGRVVDAAGAGAAYWVSVGAAAVAAGFALVTLRRT